MGIAAGFAPRAYDNRALIVAIEALLGEGGPGLNLTNVALARKLLKELT